MGVSPVFSIHQYTEEIYKVVYFKGNRDPDRIRINRSDEWQHNDTKLDNAYSRAKSMVLQYALCNPWEYFFTGTIDRKKLDRYNLDVYANKLMQFIRDKRKAYNASFQVLLVPEHHENGAWHIHGLVHGLPSSALAPFSPPAPLDLIRGGFLNWPDYQRKFGFCSLAPIKNPVGTAFYITKYISKDLSRRSDDLGKHLYFHSRPLRKAEKASDVYLFNPQLEELCVNDYDFCKTGMVEDQSWTFPFLWDGSEPASEFLLDPKPLPDPLQDFRPWEIDPIYEQMEIDL